jgi:hypothetical protein
MRFALALTLAGCHFGSGATPPDVATDVVDGEIAHDAARLDPTPGSYRATCDGSGALAIDFNHFINVSDEDQVVRVYVRGSSAGPVQSLDISAALGVATTAEVDLEDVTRIGSRVFMTASHGRKSSGSLDRARYKLAAFDLGGSPPAISLTSAGTSNLLLDQILDADNWDQPNTGVIAALDAASDLGTASDSTLAPENQGTNVEGLAHDAAGRLLVGFRNPRVNGNAIVVAIANPDGAISGQTAQVAGAAELDLGGLTLRGMAYSEVHQAVILIGGSIASGGPFALFMWSGALGDEPTQLATLTPPAMSAPEAIVPYPSTRDVQVLFDQGDADISGVQCKDAAVADRVFRDQILGF